MPIGRIDGTRFLAGALLLLVCHVTAGDSNVRFRNLTIEDGLSQSSVYSILQDDQGFMWFGTLEGLNRYDGYNFKIYRREPDNPTSLSHNWIKDLALDARGRLWVATNGGGLNRFDPARQAFVRLRAGDGSGLADDRVRLLVAGRGGGMWVGTESGLQRLDPESGTLSDVVLPLHDGAPQRVNALLQEPDGRTWVGTEDAGLLLLDRQGTLTEHFQADDGATALAGNQVRSLARDRRGRLWIGTTVGLHRFDPASREMRRYVHDEADPESLCADEIRDIYEEPNGRLWLATNKGLAQWREKSDTFAAYLNERSGDDSLVGNNVHAVFRDPSGLLWVGCHGGVSRWNTAARTFVHYAARRDGSGLTADRVTSFAEDRDGALWIGTLGGLNRMDGDGRFTHFLKDDAPGGLRDNRIGSLLVDGRGDLWVGTFTAGLHHRAAGSETFAHFAADPDNPDALSARAVTSIAEDRAGTTLYVTTYRGGLNLLDRDTGRFRRYRHGGAAASGPASDQIITQLHDDEGQVWLGTQEGLSRFSPDTGLFDHFRHSEDVETSLSSNNVFAVVEDADHDLWVGTHGGLNHLTAADRAAGRMVFRRFSRRDGLADNVVYGIVPADAHHVWLSTGKGLSRLDTRDLTFKNFHTIHGLQSEEFNAGAYYQARDGQVFFGGINGFNAFFPKLVRANPVAPPVVLVDFLLHHESVTPAPGTVLWEDINFQKELVLTHNQSVFSIEFAGLHYVDPEQNTYAYKLEGLDQDWVVTDHTKRYASFTTLAPGHYVFHVKAANNDGVWNEEGVSIALQVKPPPWRSWWAYTAYLLAGLGALGAYVSGYRRRLAEKQHVIEQLTLVDRLKDDFLANTSHELRTPLGGIIGLAESLVDGAAGPVNERQARHLRMLVGSGRRLSALVDDILDFSKLRNADVALSEKPVDLHSLVDVVLTLTRPLVAGDDPVLINAVPRDLPAALADENRLTQILHNLVGNAVKFTEHGTVTVSAERRGARLEVSVTDTGRGISPGDRARIFQSFAQLEEANVRKQGGAGLGLAITRRLVQLHGGDIQLESTLGEGSRFSFDLPATDQPAGASGVPDMLSGTRLHGMAEDFADSPEADGAADNTGARFTLLIVDDEPINRRVLANHLLDADYRILEAGGGPEALALLETEHVDLVLLDIMMPGMSGYTVCRTLRETRHMHLLPVIFLTARNQLSDLADAYHAGANDYLTKPVAKMELRARVKTHLSLLDITRTLEVRVQERTSRLSEANDAMQTLDHIVKTVNREMTLQRVLQVLLEQGLILFEHAEKAAFVLRDHEGSGYKVTASVGHDIGLNEAFVFTREQLTARYTRDAEKMERGVFLVRDVQPLPGVELPEPACLLSMTVTLEGELEGFLVFSNFHDRGAFDHSDVHMLARFREHAVSAVAKARFLEELQAKNEEIMRTQNQLIMREKMVSLGTLTAGIAHEIKNPLNFINNFGTLNADLVSEGLELLARHADDLKAEWVDHLKDVLHDLGENGKLIDKHGRKANHIVQSMMMLSREGVGERENYPLNILVEEYANLAYSGLLARDGATRVSFDRRYDDAVGHISLVVQSMGRVVLSIVTNAVESLMEKAACTPGFVPMLWISTQAHEDRVEIVVEDNGMGIPEAIRSKIYTPFFTTKDNEANIGLGLFISYDIVVQEHMGSVAMQTEEGRSCRFTLSLPRR